MKTFAPYGTWQSPINAHDISQSEIEFLDIVIDGKTIYWTENRPNEGRTVLMEYALGRETSLDVWCIPSNFDVSTFHSGDPITN